MEGHITSDTQIISFTTRVHTRRPETPSEPVNGGSRLYKSEEDRVETVPPLTLVHPSDRDWVEEVPIEDPPPQDRSDRCIKDPGKPSFPSFYFYDDSINSSVEKKEDERERTEQCHKIYTLNYNKMHSFFFLNLMIVLTILSKNMTRFGQNLCLYSSKLRTPSS